MASYFLMGCFVKPRALSMSGCMFRFGRGDVGVFAVLLIKRCLGEIWPPRGRRTGDLDSMVAIDNHSTRGLIPDATVLPLVLRTVVRKDTLSAMFVSTVVEPAAGRCAAFIMVACTYV